MLFKQINECMIHEVRFNFPNAFKLFSLTYAFLSDSAGRFTVSFSNPQNKEAHMLRALYSCSRSWSRRCLLFGTSHSHISYKRDLLRQSSRNINISPQKQFRCHWCRRDKRHRAWLKSYHNGSLAISIVKWIYVKCSCSFEDISKIL